MYCVFICKSSFSPRNPEQERIDIKGIDMPTEAKSLQRHRLARTVDEDGPFHLNRWAGHIPGGNSSHSSAGIAAVVAFPSEQEAVLGAAICSKAQQVRPILGKGLIVDLRGNSR